MAMKLLLVHCSVNEDSRVLLFDVNFIAYVQRLSCFMIKLKVIKSY